MDNLNDSLAGSSVFSHEDYLPCVRTLPGRGVYGAGGGDFLLLTLR